MLRVAEQAFRSDTGRQRTANEDSYFAADQVFAVADGMGGAQAGEVASRIAVEQFGPARRAEGQSPEAYLREIVERANARIHTLAERDSEHSGMGTTLTSALVSGDEVSLAHVGDSRAYVFRDGELRLLTSDHSLVEELRRQGRLTEEQAADHPQRSIITRALGPEAEVEVDTFTVSAKPGDVFLLCSDGLTTMVKDERIAEILAAAPNLDAAADQLVREANEAGGRDNITVVAFRLADAADVPAADAGATLIGPTAEEAGLTTGAVRNEARRGRGRRPERPRRSRARTAAKVLLGLAVIAALVVGAWYGTRQIYFLGTDEGGRLALYRGLPYELPLGIDLYTEERTVPVEVSALPEDRRESAIDHTLRSEDDAVDLLADLEQAAITNTVTEPPATDGGGQRGGKASGENRNRGSGGKARGRDGSKSKNRGSASNNRNKGSG